MSKIQLGDAVAKLWTNISETSSSDPVVIPSINEVLARFYNELDFDGKMSPDYPLNVNVDPYGNQILALPGRYIVAEYLHDSQSGCDLPTQNEFQKYMQGCCCDINCNPHAEDLGDGYPTMFDLPYVANLFVKTAATASGSFYVSGLDLNGEPISDTIALSSGGATSANQYSRILAIKKAAIATETLLYYVPTTGSNVLIGNYDPNEVYPSIRRYYISRPRGNTSIIYGKLRRRFIPAVLPTDFIVPGNIPALKQGLLAVKAQNVGNYNTFNTLWALAKAALDGELQQFIGEAQTGTFQLSRNAPMAEICNMP